MQELKNYFNPEIFLIAVKQETTHQKLQVKSFGAVCDEVGAKKIEPLQCPTDNALEKFKIQVAAPEFLQTVLQNAKHKDN